MLLILNTTLELDGVSDQYTDGGAKTAFWPKHESSNSQLIFVVYETKNLCIDYLQFIGRKYKVFRWEMTITLNFFKRNIGRSFIELELIHAQRNAFFHVIRWKGVSR